MKLQYFFTRLTFTFKLLKMDLLFPNIIINIINNFYWSDDVSILSILGNNNDSYGDDTTITTRVINSIRVYTVDLPYYSKQQSCQRATPTDLQIQLWQPQ